MQCFYTECQELTIERAKPIVGSAQLDVAWESRANHYVNLIGFGKDGCFHLFQLYGSRIYANRYKEKISD